MSVGRCSLLEKKELWWLFDFRQLVQKNNPSNLLGFTHHTNTTNNNQYNVVVMKEEVVTHLSNKTALKENLDLSDVDLLGKV